MSKLDHALTIAAIHVDRIHMAMDGLGDLFPLSSEDINHVSRDQLLLLEMLISRFSKLKDHMGRVLTDAFLADRGEVTDGLSMIDKVHLLERMGFAINGSVWQDICTTRNHVTHEYPDQPIVTAKHLNHLNGLVPVLLSIVSVMADLVKK
jgi:hypothetical protein